MRAEEITDKLREYSCSNQDPFSNEVANFIEKLTRENDQLNYNLIIKTAAAQNGQSAIETNKQLVRNFEALLKDFKELMLNPDDACIYCKYHQPCCGKECESYIKGKEAWDHKGCKHDWEWTCVDFNFGECPKLENTPCNGCIKHKMQGFEWRGVVNEQ